MEIQALQRANIVSLDLEHGVGGRSSRAHLNPHVIRINRGPIDFMTELESRAFENALARQLRASTEERANKIWTLSRNNLVIW